MPAYIITVKPETSDSELAKIKQDILGQEGTKITGEFPLIRGFACEIPDGQYSALASHPHVQSMERDGVVTTQ